MAWIFGTKAIRKVDRSRLLPRLPSHILSPVSTLDFPSPQVLKEFTAFD